MYEIRYFRVRGNNEIEPGQNVIELEIDKTTSVESIVNSAIVHPDDRIVIMLQQKFSENTVRDATKLFTEYLANRDDQTLCDFKKQFMLMVDELTPSDKSTTAYKDCIYDTIFPEGDR